MNGRRKLVGLAFGAVLLAAALPAWRNISLTQSLARARIAAFSAEPNSAIEQIVKLQTQFPRQAELAYLLAVARRRAGQTTSARECIKEAADLGWPLEDLQRQHFLIRFQSGQIEDAKPHLVEMLREGCPDALAEEIYDCMVKGYLADMRLREADVCIEHWLAWQPRSIQAHLMRAEVREGLNDSHSMAEEYREVLKIDPDNQHALWRLGFVLLDEHNVESAKPLFERYLAINPDGAMGHLGLGSCQRQMGDLAGAKAELQQAISSSSPLSDARRATALTELGQIAVSEKSYRQAIEYLEEAVRLVPNNPSAHYTLGTLLSKLNESDAANEHIETSRRLEIEAERYEDLLQQVVAHPNEVDLRSELGEILLKQGSRKEAFAWLLSALRIDRWNRAAHQALARYYADAGEQSLAKQHRIWAAKGGESSEIDASIAH